MSRSPLAERLRDILSFRAKRPRKGELDQPPARSKNGVAFGQRPYGVGLIKQHHDDIDREWMARVRHGAAAIFEKGPA
jgi:hypothetical protein